MVRKAILLALLLTAFGVLTGCHTVHGMGQDVEGAGQGMQDVAD